MMFDLNGFDAVTLAEVRRRADRGDTDGACALLMTVVEAALSRPAEQAGTLDTHGFAAACVAALGR